MRYFSFQTPFTVVTPYFFNDTAMGSNAALHYSSFVQPRIGQTPLVPSQQLLGNHEEWVDGTNKLFRKGKVAELRLELNSGGKKDKNHSAKKIALKKIVANMTMSNNDMVALFPDVVGCMQIPSLEIKKM